MVESPAITDGLDEALNAVGECSSDCSCRCHRPARDVQLIPKALRPWLGQVCVPSTLPAALWLSSHLCDNGQCLRGRQLVQTIRYTAPRWFAQVEATIRFEAFPLHFCIQTPRVVPSLEFLLRISFDDFKIKLSTRELTLCDVEPDGFSVLHASL